MPSNGHNHHRLEHIFHLLERLRLKWLLAHLPPALVWAVYMALNSFVTVGLLAALAMVTRNPFVFPSLGPTAYLFFFSPLAESSTPRNAVLGHAVGLACGFAAYWATGMHPFPQGFTGEVYWPRILSSAIALALTAVFMAILHIQHPPAGATTMIVSLGILAKPQYLGVIEMAVVLLALQAILINRMAGLPYPLWRNGTIRPLQRNSDAQGMRMWVLDVVGAVFGADSLAALAGRRVVVGGSDDAQRGV